MKKLISLAVTAVALVTVATKAFSDTGPMPMIELAREKKANDTSPFAPSSGSGSFGAGFEFTKDTDFARMLVSVDYQGFSTKGNPNRRYVVVQGRVIYDHPANTTYDNGKPGSAPVLDLEIVPVADLMSFWQNERSRGMAQIHYVPVNLQRNTDIGVAVSSSVRLIDIAASTETTLVGGAEGTQASVEHAKLTAFARMAAYVAGFRVMQMVDDSGFIGADIAELRGQAGLNLNLGSKLALRLSLGGSARYSIGSMSGGPRGDDARLSNILETEMFAKFEFLFRTAIARWSLYAQTGVRDGLHTGASTLGDSTGYIQFGLAAQFD